MCLFIFFLFRCKENGEKDPRRKSTFLSVRRLFDLRPFLAPHIRKGKGKTAMRCSVVTSGEPKKNVKIQK